MHQLCKATTLSLIITVILTATALFHPAPALAEHRDHSPPGPWRPPTGGLDLRTAFDPPPLPWMPGHRGVDLGATDAQTVVAAGPGTVMFADDLAGRGVVSIAHPNGLRTTYEPVEPSVAAGETVVAGQPIGTLQPGHASCPSAVCLHLGLKRGPLYLDPMLLFGAGKVRLLPRPGRDLAAPLATGARQ
ncbi:M23 family metallopeptidase [Glycomyces dulcitolivorans]|uniref:M23 family metallopeptidase n=1 Tax=Glycomyces dulcitolivorans TaxID=2200759 RepID=UPI000DD4659D|nr:M23 family metallopeptidase [Glycomyces dulcitolivorans]